MTCVETYTGRAFDLRSPTPEMVDIADVAHSLARINRFTGHTSVPYSVAEHALHVCHRVMALHPDAHVALHALALHHDSGEYVTGDISAPLKWLLRQMHRDTSRWPDEDSDLDLIEGRAHFAILTALGLPQPTPEHKAIIKAADLHMLKVERWSLLPNTGRHPWGTNDGQPEGWLDHPINQDFWRLAPVSEIEARFLRLSESLLAALPQSPQQK
jgi:5'-deoxynucleotidase YfbR-like HD superfamily hydrolase